MKGVKQMDLETLTKLLRSFHEELEVCMEQKQDLPGDDGVERQISDPILLGDFIVDAYNGYLAAAKAAFDDPIIQGMPEIQNLGETDHVIGDTERQTIQRSVRDYDDHEIPLVGWNPRLQKMREVALATKQLLTVLEGMKQATDAKTQNGIAGVMTLLRNLGEHIEHAQKALRESPEQIEQLVRRLIVEYNRCLEIVLEQREDAVLARMFQPLEASVGEGTSYRIILPELRLAQSGLLSYLRTTHERW
jgi:hypothetical protein